MNPKEYLTPLGIEYFRQIESILKSRGMDSEDYSIELSMLANQYAMHDDANTKAMERETAGLPGFYNEFENGTVQVNAFFTMQKESMSAIQKLSPKFGLNPVDIQKVKGSIKEPSTKPKGALAQLRKTP